MEQSSFIISDLLTHYTILLIYFKDSTKRRIKKDNKTLNKKLNQQNLRSKFYPNNQ
ncbi:unnamed protein product [Paramecium sonneborni]|uniref:Uncharacterized protein n=1 Tax=Paramecium sonneborni TaxID=65129 RepID=A0A8S1NFP3_9CILI|nr:unnamed protein product [Paramecium sonneborni]